MSLKYCSRLLRLFSLLALLGLAFVPGKAMAAATLTISNPGSITTDSRPTITVNLTNSMPPGTDTIALTLQGGPGTLTSTGNHGINNMALTAGNGNYDFTMAHINQAGTYTLTATVTLGPDTGATKTTPSFVVTAGAPATVGITSGPTPGSVQDNAPFMLGVTVNDADGFKVPDNTSVMLAISPAPTRAATGDTALTTGGIANFSVNIPTPGTYTITATSGGISSTANTTVSQRSVTETVTFGPVSQLVFGQQPTGTVSKMGISPAVTVLEEDAGGNVINTATDSITLTLNGTPPAGGTANLGGMNPKNAANGVATFSNLTVDKVGSYFLTAASGALTTANSISFNIAPGAAAKLGFGQQPTDTTSKTNIAPAVTVLVEDSAGNLVPSATNPVTLALTGTSTAGGAANLGGTKANVPAVNGAASFSNLQVDLVGTAYGLHATSAGLTATDSTSFAITQGTPSSINLGSPSPASVNADSPFTLAATVTDAGPNPVSGTPVTLTLYLADGVTHAPAGTTLTGGTATTNSSGVANFTLNINKVGTYTLIATAGSATSSASSMIMITPGTAASLAFVQQPTNTGSSAPITPAVTVKALDAHGNLVPGVSVALTLLGGSGSLSGTTPVSTGDGTGGTTLGVAVFSDLSIAATGTYQLQASDNADGVTPVNSAIFSITAGTATQFIFGQQPTDTTSESAIAPAITVEAVDSLGHVDPTYSGNITLALSGTPTAGGTAMLAGSKMSAAVNGVATFSGLSVNLAGPAYTLTASGTLPSVASTTFAVGAGAAKTLTLSAPTPGTPTAGAIFTVTATVADHAGNPKPGASVTVDLSTGSGNLGGTTTVSTGDGTGGTTLGAATFSDLTIDTAGQGKILTVTSGNASAKSMPAFTVIAGTATILSFTQQPPASTVAGAKFITPVVVKLTDVNKNPVSGATISLNLSDNTATLGGTTHHQDKSVSQTTDVNGLATFSDLNVNLIGTYTLSASTPSIGTPISSSPFMITQGPAQTLTFSPAIVPTTKAGASFSTAVTAKDTNGNLVEGAHVTLTLSAGSGTLHYSSGPPIVATTDFSGIATFNNLSIDKPGIDKQLTATSGAAMPAVNGPFTITTGDAASITFSTQPPASVTSSTPSASPPVNNPFTTAVTVTDSANNPIGGVSITLALTGGTGTLGGTTTLTTGDGTGATTLGVANFTDLTVNKAGTYTLVASAPTTSPSVPSMSSSSFTVTASTPALSFSTQPPPSSVAGLPFTTVVTLQDTSDNPIVGANVTLKLTTGKGTLSGTLTQATNSNGDATFSGLSIDIAGTDKQLTATTTIMSGGSQLTLTALTKPAFTITAAKAASLVFTQQPNNALPGQPTISAAVTVSDAFGNPVPGTDANGNPIPSVPPVTLSLPSGSGQLSETTNGTTSSGTISQTTDANGVASFTGLSIDKPGQKTLTASSGSAPSAPSVPSNSFTIGNAKPTINTPLSSYNKVTVHAGDSDFILTIEGTNFVAVNGSSPASMVTFNGTDLDPSRVTVSGDTQIIATIPASLITTAETVNVTITNPPGSGFMTPPVSDPASFPILPLGPSADAAGTAHAKDANSSTLQYFDAGLQLFSVPFDYTGQGVNPVLADFTVPGLVDLMDKGMLAVWDPALSTYGGYLVTPQVDPKYPNISANQLTLGQGYWARFKPTAASGVATSEVGLRTRGQQAQSLTDGRFIAAQNLFQIKLLPGWNMIGDPFTGSPKMGEMQVQDAKGTNYKLVDANTQGLVSKTFYKYAPSISGAAYNYVPLSPDKSDKLDPYVGYWVLAYQPCTLLIASP